MSQTVWILQSVNQLFVQDAQTPLLTVAAFTAGSLILYSFTRGKEFLIAGYSSVLFLTPFVHLS